MPASTVRRPQHLTRATGLVATLVALLAHVVWPGRIALAQTAASAAPEATEAAAKKAEAPKPSEKFPISGEIRVSPMWSAGTFVPGESHRPGLDTILGYRFAFALPKGFSISASELIIKNVFTFAESDAVRPNDTSFGDVFVTAAWSPKMTKADGTEAPWLLPGGIKGGLSLTYTVPNSRASRFQNKIGALTPAISLSRANLFGGLLSVGYGFGFIKNFNRYSNATVSSAQFANVARPSGPELLGTDVATSAVNVSFAFRNTLSANLQFTERWSAGLTYLLFNNFKYYDAPEDQYTSLNARPGRGRSDSQWGIAMVTYALDKAGHTTLSAEAFTVSPPFSADNRTYRFPFFDFRSTADNFTQVGLELQHAF